MTTTAGSNRPASPAGPYEDNGTDLCPPGTPWAQAEESIREHLIQGRPVGMRDVAGRYVTVITGAGSHVVSVLTDLSGLTASAVFAAQDARTMSRLWAIAAEIAEERPASPGAVR